MSSRFYRHKKWQAFRKACIKRANNACERCGKNGDDPNVILQVHHDEYIDGMLPWEYPIDYCEVICRGCHAEVHGKQKPSSGWEILCSDIELGEPSDPIPCENCGTEIRWHFVVYHKDWGEIVVGSECAENLSLGDAVKRLKSLQRRRKTFVNSPKWYTTNKGKKIAYRGHSVLVFKRNGLYRLKIGHQFGQKNYQTEKAAMETAFMYLNDGDF